MKLSDRRTLPRGGLTLPLFGLGGAPLGGLYRAMPDADATALLAAWWLGVRLFDTAQYCGYTRSERRLGAALADWPRDAFVLGTKVARVMREDASVQSGDDGWAELTQDGGLRALEKLRRSGVTSAVGLGVNEWQVAHVCMREFDLDCTMLAGRYWLLEQDALSPFLDDCLGRGNAVIAAGPFNSGVLAGGRTFDDAEAPASVRERVRALDAVCREFGVPLAAAALQFPLAHPAVVSCVAGVAGARSEVELRQNIEWMDAPIPHLFWQALHQRGLVDGRAPLPAN